MFRICKRAILPLFINNETTNRSIVFRPTHICQKPFQTMEIPSKYNPHKAENHWYDYWMKNDYFSSTPDSREPYTIVIPPPNVTGVLHMGHMLNNTIQDVLIRRAV